MQKKLAAIISQGCAANFGDGEKIARVLSSKFRTVFSIPQNEEPEAFYLNVCTVKGNFQALKLLREVHKKYPKSNIFITGCAPKDFCKDAIKIVPNIQFTNLKELEKSNFDFLKNEHVLRASPFIGIVNIEEGCLDACAFCSTHMVKGRLHSFSENKIIEQVKLLVEDGCKEIQLTGQDCGCYGFDIGTNLATLVQKILIHIPGDYKIRLGMGNPRHVLTYTDSLLECFSDNRIYKFLHIPVQSGSEKILKDMNRRHTVRDYVKIAEVFRTHFSNFTLSTDIIVGFPNESEEDFHLSIDLLKETRPNVCNITRFVPRPNTIAFSMNATNMVEDAIKHKRSAELSQVFQEIALQNNRKWIGKECDIVTEKIGHRNGTTIARNDAYTPVALQGKYDIGKKIRVRITSAETFALLAEPI